MLPPITFALSAGLAPIDPHEMARREGTNTAAVDGHTGDQCVSCANQPLLDGGGRGQSPCQSLPGGEGGAIVTEVDRAPPRACGGGGDHGQTSVHALQCHCETGAADHTTCCYGDRPINAQLVG